MGRRLVCSTVFALSCAVVAGCGSVGEQGSASITSPAPTATSPSTTSTPATTVPRVPAVEMTDTTGRTWGELELAPCDPTANTVSPPEWLVDALPAGFEPTSSGMSRWSSSPPPSTPTIDVWVMVDLDEQGVVRESLSLRSSAAPLQGPPPQPVEGAATVDSVRSLPGAVTLQINRSGRPWTDATWVESGMQWTALGSEALGVEGLADVLAGFELSVGSVVDPSGRFEVVGHRIDGPSTSYEVGTVELLHPASDTEISVRVDPRSPDSWGLEPFGIEVGNSLTQLDGRWVARTRDGAVVEGPGGSSVSVTILDAQVPRPKVETPVVDPVAVGLSAVAADPAGERALASPADPQALASESVCAPAP